MPSVPVLLVVHSQHCSFSAKRGISSASGALWAMAQLGGLALGEWAQSHAGFKYMLDDYSAERMREIRDGIEDQIQPVKTAVDRLERKVMDLSDESTHESRLMFFFSEVAKPAIEKCMDKIGVYYPDKDISLAL